MEFVKFEIRANGRNSVVYVNPENVTMVREIQPYITRLFFISGGKSMSSLIVRQPINEVIQKLSGTEIKEVTPNSHIDFEYE